MDLDKMLVRSDDHVATIKKDSSYLDLGKTSNKRIYSNSQHCSIKKRFKGITGNEFTCDQFGDGKGADSENNVFEKQSQSPDESDSQEVISLVKKHFIVQDLGVAEMMAEGDSKIYVHVHAKEHCKELVQRLIVHIGENKSWEVYFQKEPLIEIPNIEHLLDSGQSSIVYTDVALDTTNPVESTEINSNDMDMSNSKPVSVDTLDIHVEVTNTNDVDNNSDKTPVAGGEVRYSVHAVGTQVTNTDDVDDNSDKTPGDGGEGIISEGQTILNVDDNADKEMGVGGAVQYTVHTVDADGTKSDDVDDNSDNKPGAGGADISKYIPEDDNSDNVNKPMDVTSADESSETDAGGKNENDSKNEDSGSDSKSDSESSHSNSSPSGSSEFESGSENKSSGESSKSSKVGCEKNNVHDNKTVACDIMSEQKESAEVPAKLFLNIVMEMSLTLVMTCYLRNS